MIPVRENSEVVIKFTRIIERIYIYTHIHMGISKNQEPKYLDVLNFEPFPYGGFRK